VLTGEEARMREELSHWKPSRERLRKGELGLNYYQFIERKQANEENEKQ
jgi:hypothetical protein